MNQQLITQIEKKIKDIKSTLSLWTKSIENYQTQIEKLTKQLTEIKKQLTK